MTDIVRHRGPDGQGLHVGPGIGLGVRRLSIIDLRTGDQPVSSEDGSVTLVCNGEIYNFEALRQALEAAGHRFRGGSDVEVIAHLYEDLGPACLQRLRGMFAFALWDASRRQLMLARDRLGIKPLHYAVAPDGLYFGSEQKSILVAGRGGREIDPQALRDLFTFGFIRGPKTLLAGVRRLPPGHYLLYRDGELSLHQYWDPSFPARAEPRPQLTADEWAEALRAKLEESVRLHLRSDVPVGAWLSTGIDSSGVAALMSRSADAPIETFTLAFEEPRLNEVGTRRTLDGFPGFQLANHRVVCRQADLARLPTALWHSEDPSVSGIEIPRMLMSELAAQRVRVVLTGEGADELLGGYAWFRLDKLLRPLARLPHPLRWALARNPLLARWRPRAGRVLLAPPEMALARYADLVGLLQPEEYARLLAADLRHRLVESTEPEDAWRRPPAFETWEPFAQLQYVEMKTRLPDLVMHHVDRASMAFSLEARLPFLDHELVELCARIPPSLKMRGLREKHILREALRGVLPEEVRRRPKLGLAAPVQQWLRDELPDFAADLLSPGALRRKGYFDAGAVVELLAQHRAGRGGFGLRLMGVLGVQLWDELFVKGCRPSGGTPAPD